MVSDTNKKIFSSEDIRKAFIDYWTSEPRNCKEVQNVSLVPNNDPTLLFVNSGMFPINPYLAGQPHPLGTRLCDFQRCLRTNYDEMLEIGDNRHTLMFEMMGDWSLGDFTKVDQIPWIFGFWVDVCGLDPKRIYVSVFEGNEAVGRDDEGIKVWKETFKKYGIDAEYSDDITNIPLSLEDGENWKYRIFPYPKKKNWWQRASDAPGELGGPTSEMFYDMGKITMKQDQYHINDDSGRFIEIGNNVFMEYKFSDDGVWQPMAKKNIDFGGGFERVVMIVQGKSDIFETDLYEPILKKTAEISGKEYKTNGEENEFTRYFRILADHSRAATFILADGVIPSNKDQGYILRRFIRRLVRYGMKLGIQQDFTKSLAEAVIEKMQGAYPHLLENRDVILNEMEKEEVKFRRTLNHGLKELDKFKAELEAKGQTIDGKTAFYIYETYGFPLELTLDELGIGDDEAGKITEEFKAEETLHRDASRSGAEQKFKGGLADQSEATVRLHTTHHLLLEALQRELGDEVKQRGSNITGERLRIDVSNPDKISPEVLTEATRQVQEWIDAELDVLRIEMPKDLAEQLGAQMEFGQKYGDVVSVYMIGTFTPEFMANLEGDTEKGYQIKDKGEFLQLFEKCDIVSAEFCGGPHVTNTREIKKGSTAGNKGEFVILKEESSGSGIRRIKATVR